MDGVPAAAVDVPAAAVNVSAAAVYVPQIAGNPLVLMASLLLLTYLLKNGDPAAPL